MRRRNAGEVVTLEKRQEGTLEGARLSRVAAEQAEATKDEIATLEASGEIDAEEARRRHAEADETVARHRREVDRLERLAVKIGEDIERASGEERRREYETGHAAASDVCADVNMIAVRLARALGSAQKAAVELAAKREERKTAIDAAAELAHDAGVDFELPGNADEPEWLPDGWKEAAAIVKAGPERPQAASATRSAEYAAQQRKRQIADVVEKAARTGREPVLDELPEELHEDAHRAYERRLEVDAKARRTLERRVAIDAFEANGDEAVLAGFDPGGGTWQEAKRRRALRVKDERRERRGAPVGVGA